MDGSDGPDVQTAVDGQRDPVHVGRLVGGQEQHRGGLLVGKGGLDGNVLRIAPPLSLTEAEAREGAAILVDALAKAGE